MTDCINAALNQQEIPTPKHTHARSHTPLLSVRSTDAAHSCTCSFLPWQASTEHRKAAQPAGAQAEPDRWGVSAREGLNIEGRHTHESIFFLHSLVVKTFIVVISASEAKFLWGGNTFWIDRKIPWGLDHARQQCDEKWIKSVNTHTY